MRHDREAAASPWWCGAPARGGKSMDEAEERDGGQQLVEKIACLIFSSRFTDVGRGWQGA